MDDARYTALKVEEVLDVVKVISEGVAVIREIVSNQPTRDEFDKLRQDVHTIRAVLKATNRDVAGLDNRVTRLETA